LSVRLVTHSPSSALNAAPLLGCTEARLFTPPQRELTPETSYGFAVIDFARDVLGQPLDPWQEWAVIHAGELLPDGRPRFRIVLILVARQNGKTHLFKVLALFWQFIEQWPLTVLTSTNLEYAKEAWSQAVEMAESVPELAADIPRNGVLKGNNDVHMRTIDGCKLKIAASNRKGGRSLSIDRLGCDEIREHQDWSAWNAAYNAMNARPFGQAFVISNQGDDTSVVLDSLRESALDFIADGTGDPRLGLLEWSARDGTDVRDPAGWKAANPNLGRRLDVDTIAGAAARVAKNPGSPEEAGFKTEAMCMRVKSLDAAIDAAAWADGHVVGDLSGLRSRLGAVADISPDLQHATLSAAAVLPDGRVRVEVVQAWSGLKATAELRAALPGLLRRVRPQVFGWFPNGPAAAMAADFAERKGRTAWPPAGITVAEITAEVSAVCMGFAGLVSTRGVVHADEPLLNRHVTGASKRWREDRWRFERQGEGHCDAAYAAAGAVHLARTLPTAVGKPRVVVAS